MVVKAPVGAQSYRRGGKFPIGTGASGARRKVSLRTKFEVQRLIESNHRTEVNWVRTAIEPHLAPGGQKAFAAHNL